MSTGTTSSRRTASSHAAAEPALDAWLSERLGRPLFTVDPGLPPAAVASHAAANAPASYQARVPAGRVDLVRALTAVGFYAVDVSLRMTRRPGAVALDSGGWEVRPATAAEGPLLAELAGRSFRFDRFHLDPAIPDAVADRIKHDWVESYVRGVRGDELLAALRDGVPAGFLALLRRGGERIVDLIAIDPAAQGRGGGRALLAHFVSAEDGCDLASAGTQAANAAATRLYEALGFALAEATFNLHMHT